MSLGYVRPARTGEAAQIARIQVATWRACYTFLPAAVLDGLDEAWVAQRWRVAIDAPPSPRHRVLVAFEQGAPHSSRPPPPSQDGPQTTLVGFAASGPADEQAMAPSEAAPDPAVAAVTDLLVEPRWGRRGHGSRLLAATVDGWREDGFVSAVAWAYEADPATRRFLGSAGWEPDGARRALDVDDLLVPQLRLHTRLP
jgi:GNAT superfamily N-acetyltransferase